MQYLMTPGKHGLGWLPDLPDQRDKIFHPVPEALKLTKLARVTHVDLRDTCPPIYNQGQLGSCTAQALAAAFDFDRRKQGGAFMDPSRLFIYWNERQLEGTVDYDAGARLRDGVKTLRNDGAAKESRWPYVIAKFRDKPTATCYEEADKNQALEYRRILTPHDDPACDMLSCLNEGFPFVTGIAVYESFETDETARTGVIPMPAMSERLLGGHAVLVVGYDLGKKWFIARNSWGTAWGDNGYCYLPLEYLTRKGLADDMWVIRTVET